MCTFSSTTTNSIKTFYWLRATPNITHFSGYREFETPATHPTTNAKESEIVPVKRYTKSENEVEKTTGIKKKTYRKYSTRTVYVEGVRHCCTSTSLVEFSSTEVGACVRNWM